MLVLTRKPEEAIRLTGFNCAAGFGEITVTVLSVEGDRVKLGISAPKNVTILRQELTALVSDQNRAAAVPAHASGAIATQLLGLLCKK